MKSHFFIVEEAVNFGIEEAIILNNIRFWIDKNEANNKHFHDESYWTYNSYAAYALLFPYMTINQIKRAITNLENKGIIESGNYNTSPYDKTKWYRLKDTIDGTKNSHRETENSNRGIKSSHRMEQKPSYNTDINTYRNTDENIQIETDNKGDGFSFVEIINSEEEKKGKEKTSAKKEKPKTEIENQALEVLNFLNENRRKWLNATRDFSPDSKVHFQFITARLKTYSVDDLKGVIAVKFMQWHKDHKMSKYLTPDTLFNETNCAKYIQEVDIAKLNPNYQNEQRNLQNKDSRPNSRENIAAIYAEVDRVFGNRK